MRLGWRCWKCHKFSNWIVRSTETNTIYLIISSPFAKWQSNALKTSLYAESNSNSIKTFHSHTPLWLIAFHLIVSRQKLNFFQKKNLKQPTSTLRPKLLFRKEFVWRWKRVFLHTLLAKVANATIIGDDKLVTGQIKPIERSDFITPPTLSPETLEKTCLSLCYFNTKCSK